MRGWPRQGMNQPCEPLTLQPRCHTRALSKQPVPPRGSAARGPRERCPAVLSIVSSRLGSVGAWVATAGHELCRPYRPCEPSWARTLALQPRCHTRALSIQPVSSRGRAANGPRERCPAVLSIVSSRLGSVGAWVACSRAACAAPFAVVATDCCNGGTSRLLRRGGAAWGGCGCRGRCPIAP